MHLRIDARRLLESIHSTAKIGAKGVWGPHPTQTGVCRLALSDLDAQVRQWFQVEAEKTGCKVKVDAIGNMFAEYPGVSSLPPIAIGSHLDTQPTGGRYDGVLGVLAGLEILRTFKDAGFTPKNPISVVNWTNEEGARFPMSMMASAVWAHQVPLTDAYKVRSVTDEGDVTVESELKRIGYLGAVPASYKANPLSAHFELHIEQGPILEAQNKRIGILTGVQAYTWYRVNIHGRAQHTGTTPLSARKDAMLAASRMIVEANAVAEKLGGLASVGILTTQPGAVNVIPEHVSFTLDFRHKLDSGLSDMDTAIREQFSAIAAAGNRTASSEPLDVEFETLYQSPAVYFHSDCIDCVRNAASDVVGSDSTINVVSGAGHDSCNASKHVPTSMIFVPSKGGVSHNPAEYTAPDEIADGAQVLLEAVLHYDELLASK